jgi:H+/Cl- antiporter ClcA
MNKKWFSFEQLSITRYLFYWMLRIVPVSIAVGSLVALFLWLLDLATTARWQHLWLIFLLPLAGALISFLYREYGKNSDAGNNLIIDEIHEPGGGIPARMTPFILISTIITHLFGGSAGREGTAVQMGGSVSFLFSKWYGLSAADKRILLMCGMSAGFGAVFGTPVAGAIFALEVLAIGTIKYDALVPCLIAGVLADITCAAYGIHHTQYTISYLNDGKHGLPFLPVDLLLLGKVMIAGAFFGMAGYLFAQIAHTIKNSVNKYIPINWLIPVCGGAAVIAISYALGTFDYLGLGVTNPNNGISIVSAFTANGANTWSWLWKLLLTAITLSTGFKGGEVTPLFFIGATLGNTLAVISGSPVDLFAGLGFIAVFAGATNTPIACTLMGVELFGGQNVLYYVVACFTAYYFSGHSGIYGAQKIGVSKMNFTYDATPPHKKV